MGSELIKQQMHNLHNLGKRLSGAKTQLATLQKEIKNKWIQIISDEISENVKNRTRIAWNRSNKHKGNTGVETKGRELQDHNGEMNTPYMEFPESRIIPCDKNAIIHQRNQNSPQLMRNYGMIVANWMYMRLTLTRQTIETTRVYENTSAPTSGHRLNR